MRPHHVCNVGEILLFRGIILLKVTDITIQVSDIFYLTVSFNLIKFSFQIFLLFSAMSTSFTSYTVQASTWFSLDPPTNAFQPAAFDLRIVNILHQTMDFTASIHAGLRLSLADVLIFSLFSQDLFIFSLSRKFSKAKNLFEILTLILLTWRKW